MYRTWIKRALDIVLSALGLLVLGLPMLIIALIIKIDDPGPAIFQQKRIGLGGKVFLIYKFRSMKIGAEKTGTGVYSQKGDPRVTRVGRILRATSLDEIPQLLNILPGQMSFIGPRPPLTYHPWPFEQYTSDQKKMFSVRPGITGWAQIHGRKAVHWNDRIEMNIWYVDNLSFVLDLKILFKTVFKVLSNADNENIDKTAS